MTRMTTTEIRSRRRFNAVSSLALAAAAGGLFFLFRSTATGAAQTVAVMTI